MRAKADEIAVMQEKPPGDHWRATYVVAAHADLAREIATAPTGGGWRYRIAVYPLDAQGAPLDEPSGFVYPDRRYTRMSELRSQRAQAIDARNWDRVASLDAKLARFKK